MPKLKSMKFGPEAFSECVKATFENLPELRSIEFEIESFMFSKDLYQHNELIMRNLPKLETFKVDTWMSSTFGCLCSVTMENIPSANDVVFYSAAFKYVRNITLKSIQSTIQVIYRHFHPPDEVFCE
ncbi:hypothetical protein BLSTO_05968 [Blastocystis sp. subtype 1]